ncbi:hypothetical protein F4801DRAFT_585479 [Xylaria longipes]|nr:hypothetical protein F4801DRAFT_585479 [Xylaria longipes]
MVSGEDCVGELNPWREDINIIISFSVLHIYHRISSATTASRILAHKSRAKSNLHGSAGSGGGHESQLHILGSRNFRRAVPVVNENNWVAIAVLIFRLDSCRQSTTFSGVVTDSLLALRSAGIMGNEINPFSLGSGAFGKYLMSRTRRSSPKVVDPAIVLALAHLKAITEERKLTDSSDAAEQNACARAIAAMRGLRVGQAPHLAALCVVAGGHPA